MCNDECDLNCYIKCKSQFSLFDKIVLGFTLTMMLCALILIIIGMFYPERLICN